MLVFFFFSKKLRHLEEKNDAELRYTKTNYLTGTRKIHEIKKRAPLMYCLSWCIECMPKTKKKNKELNMLKKAMKDDRLFVTIT